MPKKSRRARLEEAKIRLEAFSKVWGQFTSTLERVSGELPNLGMFAVGVYGAEGPITKRLVGGLKSVVGYKLAQSPNLVVGPAGLGWVSATLIKAGSKAVDETRVWYER